MEITQAAIQIVILIIPGLIFFKCYSTIIGEKRKSDWETIFEIIFVSIICYLFVSVANSITYTTINDTNQFSISLSFELSNNLQALYTDNINPNFGEIIFASIIGILLSFLWAKFTNKKTLNKIATKLKINFRTGRDDVWEDFIIKAGNNYIVIRDHKTAYHYYGYIMIYSESGKKRELVLGNVTVYDSYTDEEKHCVDKLYISRNDDDIDFEVFKQE